MNMLLQILPCVLFLFFFPVIIDSKKSCPVSSCLSNSYDLQVKYPFKLDTDYNPKHCQDYITLRCSDQGQTMLNLPTYGDFIVDYFDYYSHRISVTDPYECLPRRLMTNLSLSPFKAPYTEYTFYTCPRKPIESERITYIECMSNSTNVTVAIVDSNYSFLKYYGCETLVRLPLPIPSEPSGFYTVISDVLDLTWNTPDCEDCSSNGIRESGNDDSSRSGWSKFISSPIVIPSVVVLVAFFGLACVVRVLKLTGGRRYSTGTGDNTTNMNDNAESTTSGATTAALNEANQSSTVNKPCTEIIVVDDTNSMSLPQAETSCCSICLEHYQEKDTVRYLSQCGHYFHAHCVDQWFHKNTTCPVCRDKLSGSIL